MPLPPSPKLINVITYDVIYQIHACNCFIIEFEWSECNNYLWECWLPKADQKVLPILTDGFDECMTTYLHCKSTVWLKWQYKRIIFSCALCGGNYASIITIQFWWTKKSYIKWPVVCELTLLNKLENKPALEYKSHIDWSIFLALFCWSYFSPPKQAVTMDT